ncbi:10739_t:CDS:2, partial [Cetraspora pellucida]
MNNDSSKTIVTAYRNTVTDTQQHRRTRSAGVMQDPVLHINSHDIAQGPVFYNDTQVPLLDTNSHEAIQVPCINSYAVQVPNSQKIPISLGRKQTWKFILSMTCNTVVLLILPILLIPKCLMLIQRKLSPSYSISSLIVIGLIFFIIFFKSHNYKEYAESETRLVPNYALLSGGARVIPHMTSSEYVGYPEEFIKRQISKIFNIKSTQSKPAKIVLTSNNEAGNCFCFTSTHGQLAIHLSHNIKVTSITYEHLNPALALVPDDMRRAPKTFEIVGISVDSQEKNDEYIQLGSFVYELDGPPAQSFAIKHPNLELLPVMKAVVLKIKDNWGDEELTCLYQVK